MQQAGRRVVLVLADEVSGGVARVIAR